NGWAEQSAAGGEHQAVVLQCEAVLLGADNLHCPATRVDGLDGTLDVVDVDRPEKIAEWRRQRLRVWLVEARADHEPRLRRHQDDLEIARGNATRVAQAGR